MPVNTDYAICNLEHIDNPKYKRPDTDIAQELEKLLSYDERPVLQKQLHASAQRTVEYTVNQIKRLLKHWASESKEIIELGQSIVTQFNNYHQLNLMEAVKFVESKTYEPNFKSVALVYEAKESVRNCIHAWQLYNALAKRP